ncbi:hypothetical protein SADUNF_Sadunf17G0019300 [Salix dunnii]|uniref:Uncharacterized protein n=1 Tax=Salix dunnii TaxID=1413687 RepID=A0A835J4P3_9ROSI|nr:hypothetical protein SADUNF_Sadunf17G0019300 [Salix dunnii]
MHEDLSWMDDLIFGGEILLTDENVAPVIPMPDVPETGLGTEPADQPFEMDMSNIFIAERGSSSKRPVDRSVPSSSNNEATNAASTPFRGLAVEQPRLDDGLAGMDILNSGETGLVEEPRAPDVIMTDEPETRQRTEQAHQSFETNTKNISSSSMMDDYQRTRLIVKQIYALALAVGVREATGCSSKVDGHDYFHEGQVLLAAHKRIQHQLSVILGEVRAALHGLLVAHQTVNLGRVVEHVTVLMEDAPSSLTAMTVKEVSPSSV